MDLKSADRFFNPYRTVLASLIILVFINAKTVGFKEAALSSFVSLIVSVGIDSALTYIKTKKLVFSYGPAISGLILSLVFSPNFPLYYIAAAAFLSQLLKHVIRHNNNNIFNPASLAMIITFLFVPAEAWWGNKLYEALILGIIVSWRIKRLPASIAFMAAYSALSIFLHQNPESSTAWIFFAFFMLVEPRTSPRLPKAQIIYGALIALVAVLGFANRIYSPVLSGLLIGNIANALYLLKMK